MWAPPACTLPIPARSDTLWGDINLRHTFSQEFSQVFQRGGVANEEVIFIPAPPPPRVCHKASKEIATDTHIAGLEVYSLKTIPNWIWAPNDNRRIPQPLPHLKSIAVTPSPTEQIWRKQVKRWIGYWGGFFCFFFVLNKSQLRGKWFVLFDTWEAQCTSVLYIYYGYMYLYIFMNTCEKNTNTIWIHSGAFPFTSNQRPALIPPPKKQKINSDPNLQDASFKAVHL